MKSRFIYLLGALATIIILVLVYQLLLSSTKAEMKDELKTEIHKNYRVYAPPIPDSLYFAGEAVPMHQFYVREALDRELISSTYRHSLTLLYFKRANRYFPLIEKILKEENVPEDMKYIVLAESGLSNATSPRGAKGYWQFMKATAKQYKLEVNEDVDERYHLEKSTRAACKYLKDAYKKFKSWTSAAAAYNMGSGGLSKNIRRQGSDSFYDLYLNTETSRYIFRILAIKLVHENPHDYGFRLRKNDLYPEIPVKTIEIDSSISNMYNFARELGVSYRLLKTMNPWLRNNELKNKKSKSYMIKLPAKPGMKYNELLDPEGDRWPGINDGDTLDEHR
jgi:membrane-bound lytic murein transglycosylase D